MNNTSRRSPLPVKLLLIGSIPLALLLYTFLQAYREKMVTAGTLIFFIICLLATAFIVYYAMTINRRQPQPVSDKYQTIFYNSPLPHWIYDFETLQFLEVNEAAIKHYGYSREEFLAMTLYDIRPKEDHDNFSNHIKEVKSGDDKKQQHYWRHLRKNGDTIEVEVTTYFIDYSNKKARAAVIVDITSKLKAEEKLAASERRFRSITEQFPFPVVTYDPEGNFTSVNKAWETMWQYKREDVKEYNIRKDPQMIASGLSVYVEKAFAGEVAVSEPYQYDPVIIGHRSRKRWMVMTLFPLKDSKEEVLEVILILQDVTDTKDAEEVIRSSEEKRRLIMNAALDAIVTIDKKGAVSFWNPPAEKMFGWKENEMIGKQLTETIIPPKYRDAHQSGLAHYQQTGEGPVLNKLIEITALAKNGKEFPIELFIIPIEQGDEKTFCAFIRDISERKKAEEKLKQSHEDLRQLASHLQNIREDERSNIAREVHDELGQQITCIKMDVSWLLKRIQTEDPNEKEKMKRIPELIDKTSVTVRKIAAELRPSILDDFGLIDALEWQSNEFKERSGIDVQFDSTVPSVTISKDVTNALFRIYQESLTNVARHAEATEVIVNASLKNDQLVLSIADNGKGFDVTSSNQKKTLGLLGMRERTLMIGGKYEIQSMPGKGTTVTVAVPLHQKEANVAGGEKI